MPENCDIMKPDEVARYLKMSQSWVYKHWRMLGGTKLGGSLLFPNREILYERIFCKKQRMEVRFPPQRSKEYPVRVPNEKGGQTGRGKQEGGDKKSPQNPGSPNRHGLLGTD
jgi:hypothetical protein